jgi:hypothetical protein
MFYKQGNVVKIWKIRRNVQILEGLIVVNGKDGWGGLVEIYWECGLWKLFKYRVQS